MGSQLSIKSVAEIVPDFWAVIAWAPENLAAGRALKDINFHLQQGCVCSPQSPAQAESSSGLSLHCHQGLHWGDSANYAFLFTLLFNKTQ